MSHPVVRRFAGLGLGTLAVVAAIPALAADLAYPPYPGEEPAPSRVYREEHIEEELPPPPPPPPPRRPVAYGPRFAAGPYGAPPPPPEEACRTIVRHRIDPYGDAIERRVRICDERPGPRFRPSFYRPHPVPPADVPYGGRDEPPRW